MAQITPGMTVRQAAPVIQGPVTDARWSVTAKKMEYLVQFQVDGEPAERWFYEGDLVVVEDVQ